MFLRETKNNFPVVLGSIVLHCYDPFVFWSSLSFSLNRSGILFFSQKQVDRVMHTLKKPAVNALSTKAVLKALDRHVQVAECVVRGHLTMYQDLLVLVEPTVRVPTALQLEACLRESEKLSALVESSSPRVLTDLSLSMLISARPVHELVTNSAAATVALSPVMALSLLLALTMLII